MADFLNSLNEELEVSQDQMKAECETSGFAFQHLNCTGDCCCLVSADVGIVIVVMTECDNSDSTIDIIVKFYFWVNINVEPASFCSTIFPYCSQNADCIECCYSLLVESDDIIVICFEVYEMTSIKESRKSEFISDYKIK